MEIFKDGGAPNTSSKDELSMFLYVLRCALSYESIKNHFSKKTIFDWKTGFFRKIGNEKPYPPKPLSYSESAWSITYNPLGFEQKAIEQLVTFPR